MDRNSIDFKWEVVNFDVFNYDCRWEVLTSLKFTYDYSWEVLTRVKKYINFVSHFDRVGAEALVHNS